MTKSAILTRHLPFWLAGCLISVALSFGIFTTRGLEWPDLSDRAMGEGPALYRDMASARAMLEDGYGPDPIYRGERTWYNPIVPAVIAGVSAAAPWPMHVVATQLGAYANVLAPLCFFWMCVVLFGRWCALFSLAGFLYILPGRLPAWLSATYSPWLMPINFVQAFFYLSVIALYRAERDGRPRSFVLPGVLWGATFLGHTAPALVFGGIVVLRTLAAIRKERRLSGSTFRTALASAAVMVTSAIVVSIPYLAIIVGHYGLHIRNGAPSAASVALLSRELPTLVWLHLTLPMTVVSIGLWIVVRHAHRPVARALVLHWIGVTWLFLLYSFFRLGAKLVGVEMPSVVPSFHFFFYFKAATAVLFGVGLAWIGRLMAVTIAWRALSSPVTARARLAAGLACCLLIIVAAPTYASRDNLWPARRGSLVTASSDRVAVLKWLLSHRSPTDVALADDADAVYVCAPAGVRAVVAAPIWSNPYIDLHPRQQARDRMFELLDSDDIAAFRDLARLYGVTLVITQRPRSERYDAATPQSLELMFSTGSWRVYRVRPAGIPMVRKRLSQ